MRFRKLHERFVFHITSSILRFTIQHSYCIKYPAFEKIGLDLRLAQLKTKNSVFTSIFHIIVIKKLNESAKVIIYIIYYILISILYIYYILIFFYIIYIIIFHRNTQVRRNRFIFMENLYSQILCTSLHE